MYMHTRESVWMCPCMIYLYIYIVCVHVCKFCVNTCAHITRIHRMRASRYTYMLLLFLYQYDFSAESMTVQDHAKSCSFADYRVLMADNDAVSQFCAICNTEPSVARFYLQIGGNSLERGLTYKIVSHLQLAHLTMHVLIFRMTNIFLHTYLQPRMHILLIRTGTLNMKTHRVRT